MDEEIIENLNERLDTALDRGRRIVEDEELAKRIDDVKLRTENLIRKHPVKSVAGGLVIGYLLGKLLSSDE